jgi:hypothetical protein
MRAVTRLAVAVASAGIAINAAWYDAAAQNPIGHARDVRAALLACWIAPGGGAPRQISVRFSFNRDGQVVGQPLIRESAAFRREPHRSAGCDRAGLGALRAAPLER